MKTNSQLLSKSRNEKASLRALFEERETKTTPTSGFSLWKNAYLNCGDIRLKALLGREVHLLMGKSEFVVLAELGSPSAQTLLLASQALCSWAIIQPWQTGCRKLLSDRTLCVTNINCTLALMVQKYFAADRCHLNLLSTVVLNADLSLPFLAICQFLIALNHCQVLLYSPIVL